MTVLSINSCNYGSTGNIMMNLSELAIKEGIDSFVAFPDSKQNRRKDVQNCIVIGNRYNRNIAWLLSTYTGKNGCFGYFYTRRFLKKVAKLRPDIVHLHNIHNSYINLPLLFKFLKRENIKVIWTLHDCWSFTGRCPYFQLTKCDKWKNGCGNCLYPENEYPQAKTDITAKMWGVKKQLFTGVEDLTIVTPSKWLSDLVKQSFLKDYSIKVINNGIDLNVFKPTPSNFKEKYNIADKFIILGVAFGWRERKGLDVFIELNKRLDKNQYRIVLVGTDEGVDAQLPKDIISIHRTHNQKELAEIYTAADLFVNPTREENYPTVNMESIACGTPVLTFRTGGSPEILTDKTGSVVDCDDIDGLEKEIIRIKQESPFSKEDCIEHAKSFDMNQRFNEYIQLYKELQTTGK